MDKLDTILDGEKFTADMIAICNLERGINIKNKYMDLLQVKDENLEIILDINEGQECCKCEKRLDSKVITEINRVSKILKDYNSEVAIEIYTSLKYRDFYGECEDKNITIMYVKDNDTKFILKLK
ncbi:TPA: hypothetical protein ACF0PM_002248 [Clostridium perfringens]